MLPSCVLWLSESSGKLMQNLIFKSPLVLFYASERAAAKWEADIERETFIERN